VASWRTIRIAVKTSDIDIVMVHYHAAAMAARAVEALQRDAASSSLSIHIFVVDNGSTPAERALLESLQVSVVSAGQNLNFPAGVQFGFAFTSASRVILMNEDVLVLPGCLARLRQALDDGAFVAGPELYWDLDGVFSLPCTEERTRRNELLKAAGWRNAQALTRARTRWRDHARLQWRSTAPLETIAISGALLAFRREVWEIAGPFGQGYHMYFDENDWLLRMQRAGLRTLYVPDAKAVHLHNPKLMGDDDRAKWSSESFVRFGNRYYGETFMRRLVTLAYRPPAFPEWQPIAVEADGATVEVPIPPAPAWPVWIELTPSPFGYPAAATRITDPSTRRWRLPVMRGLPFLTGTLYLQVVDDAGNELGHYCFERRSVPEEIRTFEQEEALSCGA
jgi:GT2 family glycosyltransferase